MVRSADRLVAVGHAIAVVVRVGLVADTVAVGVQPLCWVEWEFVQAVIDAIAVVVRVGLVADPVAVGVQPLCWVQWEVVQSVIDAIAVVVRVGLVADPVAVGVQPFRGVEGEGVGARLADACDRCRPVAEPIAVCVRAGRACARGALV